MEINFNEDKHEYRVDNNIAELSVTELLSKHGLSPNYSGVDKEYLKQAAERGTDIHADIAQIVNKKYKPRTEAGKNFRKYAEDNLAFLTTEQMLAYNYKGLRIAGTADLLGLTIDGELLIGDHKVTKSINKEYVTWQTSIYDYFLKKLSGEKVNGVNVRWKGAKLFKCYQYNPDSGELKVHDLKRVSDADIEELLECEYNGKIYQRKELVLADEFIGQLEKIETRLSEIKRIEKAAQAEADETRATIISEFKRQGIKSFETDKVKVTYIEPMDKFVVDSTKLKREFPNIYDKTIKISHVKESVRITVKGEEE